MSYTRIFKAILVIWLTSGAFMALSQSNAPQIVDYQFWMNYALTIRANENFSYGGDAGIRGVWSNEEWNQILVRPSVAYRFNPILQISGAGAIFKTLNADIENETEFRLHQEVTVDWPDLGFMTLFYRLRIEQRFFHEDGAQQDFNFRSRYLIGMESEDIRLFGSSRPIYFQAMLEGFRTAGDEATEIFINRRRIHGAIGHRISNLFRYELHYIGQSSRRLESVGFETSQHVFRIRLFHTIIKKTEEDDT